MPQPDTAQDLSGKATRNGDRYCIPDPELLGNFERVLRHFFLGFLVPHREYVRMRKDLISKKEEAKLILGLKLPSATERRLCFLHQQTSPEAMAASENFPGILPLFLETCAGPLQARKAH